MNKTIAFIGGGNMASAMIGGLIQQGVKPSSILVAEPFAVAREKLLADFGVVAHEAISSTFNAADIVIWAVKPQTFKDAALAAKNANAFKASALHFSVAAGIPTNSMCAWLGTERIVRAMPNTPALIGKGITGLFARPAVTAADKADVEQVVANMGQFVWLDSESKLDAVTAISGSGPAYVFYFLEAMTEAAVQMGLSADEGRKLAIATFSGATELAERSDESLEVLRQRVTSKGGTTYAAITSMQSNEVAQKYVQAMLAAEQRAKELGDEFGR
jgi:pyrroline-5-carboxylate reductase